MKILICGGGIGGLSTYLFLRKQLAATLPRGEPLEINILEKYLIDQEKQQKETEKGPNVPSTLVIGAAFFVSPNGMQVLKDLDEDIFQEAMATGGQVKNFRLRNRQGWTFGAIRGQNYDTPALPTVMIGRQELWKILRNRIPDEDVRGAIVSGVDSTPGQKPRVIFSDGSASEEADLVLGADGVRSSIRRAVVDDADGTKYPARYEGLRSVFGWAPRSMLGPDHEEGVVTMTLGSAGFFAYGVHAPKGYHKYVKPDKAAEHPGEDGVMWWSTYPVAEHPSESGDDDQVDWVKGLLKRHGDWNDPVIQAFLDKSNPELKLATWSVPELPTWIMNGHVALLGDAAHGLQSSAGQGVSQALEDAQVLSTLLAHCVPKKEEGIPAALDKYMAMRKPRIDRIEERSRKMGNTKHEKNLLQEYVTYFILWAVSMWGKDPYMEWLYKELPRDELKKALES